MKNSEELSNMVANFMMQSNIIKSGVSHSTCKEMFQKWFEENYNKDANENKLKIIRSIIGFKNVVDAYINNINKSKMDKNVYAEYCDELKKTGNLQSFLKTVSKYNTESELRSPATIVIDTLNQKKA